MRLIFIGDVVGRTGREAIQRHLPGLRAKHAPDIVVVNGENAAHGFGITEDIFNGFTEAGADIVTLGNHSFDQREALVFIERVPNLLRPLNYPQGAPGRGTA
ncbi:MAG: YmdB family metallophosphoesterase, partial [Parvibaculaceae bacterium]